ncbi:MAG TPA: protein kinase [Candidatus Krumholzibacteria bacterium]|nr:protein kinase [Candidatus Krumholzibacteria bacterium]
MIGKTLAHYTITGQLGRGGMGEVYRARDTRLDRDVALKILPAEFADDPSRLERFEREAKTVAGLNHPHIVHMYSVEEDRGIRFLTMELVEGRSLDEGLPTDGLPLSQVFEIGIAIADALASAHAKGIVHRDLKPANVMVTEDGRVKVLDFGLAKVIQDTSGSDIDATEIVGLTQLGAVMGTVPHMSPEQLRGQAVDSRSDIFSLGILLYELAAGRRPFVGVSNADVTSAILRETPQLLTELKPELPGPLSRIVMRCLEKEQDNRYQSALDIRNDLRELRREVDSGVSRSSSWMSETKPVTRGARGRWWMAVSAVALVFVAAIVFLQGRGKQTPATEPVPTPPAPPEQSIAVLPFADLSPQQDKEYFSDGIAEELLNLLARVHGLKVTARTSSFSFKGKEVEVPEIGRQLGVSHVLEGSVRMAGDRVRITAQLIQTADGFQVWSQNWDRTLDDIFAIQDEIAGEVVKELKVTLLGDAPKVRATDPKAYALYLQAVQLAGMRSADGFAQSDSLYRAALAIDPDYAPAWVNLAGNLVNEVFLGLSSADEGFPRAQQAANKALAIDQESADAHGALGSIAVGEGKLADAAMHFKRALELDPASPSVLGNSSALLKSLGRLDDAIALDEEAVRLDPINTAWLFNLAAAKHWAGHEDEAIALFRTVLSLSPGFGGAHLLLGEALLAKGDAEAALAEFNQEQYELYRLIGLPLAYHDLGRDAEFKSALDEVVTKLGPVSPYDAGSVFAYCGDADSAFEWLGKSVAANDGGSLLILVDSLYKSVHSDPRWLPLLRKLGKAPDQVDKIEFKVTLPTSES